MCPVKSVEYVYCVCDEYPRRNCRERQRTVRTAGCVHVRCQYRSPALAHCVTHQRGRHTLSPGFEASINLHYVKMESWASWYGFMMSNSGNDGGLVKRKQVRACAVFFSTSPLSFALFNIINLHFMRMDVVTAALMQTNYLEDTSVYFFIVRQTERSEPPEDTRAVLMRLSASSRM